MQVVQRCAGVQQLESSQVETDHPDWLANARVPVLVGGYIGFLVAYCVGLYTIFHVAQAYKKLELKVSHELCYTSLEVRIMTSKSRSLASPSRTHLGYCLATSKDLGRLLRTSAASMYQLLYEEELQVPVQEGRWQRHTISHELIVCRVCVYDVRVGCMCS